MPRDDTSSASYRAERGEPPRGTDSVPDQSELSVGAMTRGTVGQEGADQSTSSDADGSASPGADSDREAAESSLAATIAVETVRSRRADVL